MIDLHCHVLPGIDDGPTTVEESLGLAREAAARGARVVVATPHVSRRYRNDVETIACLVAELNARLAAESVALEIRAGAEISVARAVEMSADELQRYGLAGGPWLLVEPPFSPIATGLDILFAELQRRGHRLLLAHPERCPAFQRDPQLLHSLVASGILTSITAGSLVGRFGGDVRRFALRLIRDGVVHNVASDAHDLRERPPGTAAELEQAGVGALGQWLTCAVPEAIIEGRELPRRPEEARAAVGPAPRRWGLGRLMRAS